MSEMTTTRALAMRDAMARNARKQVYGDWHLVQPLERRAARASEPAVFDDWFEPSLMGDANYEGDGPLASLVRMRAADQIELRASEFTHDGVTKTVYFVGPGGQNLRNKILGCRVWLTLDHGESCIPSHFDEHFTGVPRYSHWSLDLCIVGWWSLNDDVMWSLDRQVADDMVAAINARS